MLTVCYAVDDIVLIAEDTFWEEVFAYIQIYFRKIQT